MGIRFKGRYGALSVFPPLAALAALAVHLLVPDSELVPDTGAYAFLLYAILGAYAAALAASAFHGGFAARLRHKSPLIGALLLFFAAWDLATLKTAALPLPYFPGPDKVFGVFATETQMLLTSVLHSLRLLFTGYLIGAVLGLVTGVAIGWSSRIHYWVNPVFKFIGPIPATAWVPIAMNVLPTSFAAGVFLIALSVWFSVTFMTSSGVSGVKNSYFEVAKTLGAGRWTQIFRVAIPAAYPLIFIGFFMGLGMSFATLIVSEMLGVEAGLGYFILWAQGWGEYAKVYAALIVIAILFSALIALLFKIKDRVLIWQKGLIKW
jgi:NitT/TauT family transport system permease protein